MKAELLLAGAIGIGTLYFMQKQAKKDQAPAAAAVPQIYVLNSPFDNGSAPPQGGALQHAGSANVAQPSIWGQTAAGWAPTGAFIGATGPKGSFFGPGTGAGMAVGAGLRGFQSVAQGLADWRDQAKGTGPYAGWTPAQASTGIFANVVGGAGVGALGYGAVGLDFNRGVDLVGIPVATKIQPTSTGINTTGSMRDSTNAATLAATHAAEENARKDRVSLFGQEILNWWKL